MSRIRTSENYWGHKGRWNAFWKRYVPGKCPAGLYECERHYCPAHRLLWRDCDTAKKGWEGDFDVPGGTREILDMGDCPSCEDEARAERNRREMAMWEAEMKRRERDGE